MTDETQSAAIRWLEHVDETFNYYLDRADTLRVRIRNAEKRMAPGDSEAYLASLWEQEFEALERVHQLAAMVREHEQWHDEDTTKEKANG